MHDALQGVAVDGIKSVEDGLIGIISGTESVASAFKKMATSIVSDLLRIAAEKAILSLLGFSTGGQVGGGAAGSDDFDYIGLAGYADGGPLVRGPGSSTSDSILARLSNGEFVVNAAATAKHLPLLRAINDNSLPGFADGGLIGSYPSIPTGYPALPSASQLRVANDRGPISFDLRGAVMTADLLAQMQQMALQSGGQAYVGAVAHTNQSIAGLRRPSL